MIRRLDSMRGFFYYSREVAREIDARAHAKINLHLEILGRGEDGFHDIRSIFQIVDLSDRIILSVSGMRGSLEILGDFGIPRERNIISRAVALFREETGVREGISIRAEKRIPIGGGMGGGSSDAASTLRGLQVLFDRPVDQARLVAIGSRLGSDVPFFLSAAAAAMVEGRGEKVDSLTARDDFSILAVTAPDGMDTAKAYKWLDEDRDAPVRPRLDSDALKRMYLDSAVSWGFFNDFDGPVFRRRQDLAGARRALEEAGAMNPRLTGSGSTVIGILPGRASAERCVRRLKDLHARILLPLAFMDSLG
jgi:4-diphosphocytidyl-2-C-methyl-D-erythritol kinase